MTHITKSRRRYNDTGRRCADCGTSRTTNVHFWVNNMPYVVCSTCIRPYRAQLLKPCSCEGN